MIANAKWLGEADTKLCLSCCQLYEMYLRCLKLWQDDPTDKEARIACTNANDRWRATMKDLHLDPLGRERMSQRQPHESADTDDPLKEFGICG